jgi:hypothetical protein
MNAVTVRTVLVPLTSSFEFASNIFVAERTGHRRPNQPDEGTRSRYEIEQDIQFFELPETGS